MPVLSTKEEMFIKKIKITQGSGPRPHDRSFTAHCSGGARRATAGRPYSLSLISCDSSLAKPFTVEKNRQILPE
jgi:hypothetical protein